MLKTNEGSLAALYMSTVADQSVPIMRSPATRTNTFKRKSESFPAARRGRGNLTNGSVHSTLAIDFQPTAKIGADQLTRLLRRRVL